MSFATNVSNLATRIGTEFKTIRTLISGTGTGDVSGLNTTATNLVAAVNEVKVTADSAAGGGVAINDTATNSSETWSSTKIDSEISGAVSGILDGAPAALDTLNELAAAINDDASYASTLTTALGNKANSSDVYTRVELGDPSTNYVTVFETALT
jgi:hypothetical protein